MEPDDGDVKAWDADWPAAAAAAAATGGRIVNVCGMNDDDCAPTGVTYDDGTEPAIPLWFSWYCCSGGWNDEDEAPDAGAFRITRCWVCIRTFKQIVSTTEYRCHHNTEEQLNYGCCRSKCTCSLPAFQRPSVNPMSHDCSDTRSVRCSRFCRRRPNSLELAAWQSAWPSCWTWQISPRPEDITSLPDLVIHTQRIRGVSRNALYKSTFTYSKWSQFIAIDLF